MLTYTRKLSLIALLMLSPLAVFSQTECPAGLICLTQAEANAAAQNARELAATKEKVIVLEDALKSKDETIRELQATGDKNVADLKEALRKTEIALATATGQLIARESEVVRQSKIIEAMIPMLRKKKIGILNVF